LQESKIKATVLVSISEIGLDVGCFFTCALRRKGYWFSSIGEPFWRGASSTGSAKHGFTDRREPTLVLSEVEISFTPALAGRD